MSTSSLRRRTATVPPSGAACSGAPPRTWPSQAQPLSARSQTSRLAMPMNAATYSVAGLLEDVLGGVVLLDASVAHDGQPVTEGERLGLVVGDEHGGEPEPTVELVDLGPHLVAQAGVEVAERLVEQHEVGSGDEAAGERDALLLATAELRRIAVEQRSAVDEGGGLLDPAALQALLDLAGLQRVVDVLAHRHVRPQRVRLEHHADVALVRRQVDPAGGVEHRGRAEADPARARRLQPGEAPQRGRLAAPARTEEDEELALLDLEIEVVDRRWSAACRRSASSVDWMLTWDTCVTSLRALRSCGTAAAYLNRSFHLAWYSATNSGVRMLRSWTRTLSTVVDGAGDVGQHGCCLAGDRLLAGLR